MEDGNNRNPLSALALRLGAAGQSAAWAVASEALHRVASGERIMLLSLGDPATAPHPAIIAATKKALDAGRTHYTPLLGEMPLRRAIAQKEGVQPAEIAVVPGAQHGGLAVLALIAGPGDEVILSDPHYATYPGMVAATGAKAVKVSVRPDLSADIDGIARAITPRTKVLFLNSPANPTGATISAADFRLLSALCERHDLWLLVDEVYASFGYAGPPPRALRHGPQGRTISTNSLSKSHAMTGYRVGWVAGPERLIAALEDWAAAATFGVAQFVQDGALAALALHEEELRPYRQGFRQRAALVVERASAIPGLCAAMPQGGMFVLVDCRAIASDDVALSWRLLREANVATIPGSAFGAGGRGHIRISLTPDEETLGRAFDAIAAALAG